LFSKKAKHAAPPRGTERFIVEATFVVEASFAAGAQAAGTACLDAGGPDQEADER